MTTVHPAILGLDAPAHLRGNHIGGQWIATAPLCVISNINPGDLSDSLGDFANGNAVDAAAAAQAAHDARIGWEAMGAVARGRILGRAARLLDERREFLASVITRENGKPLTDARGEVDRAAEHVTFFAGEGRRLGGHVAPADDAGVLALAEQVPIGVVALITPFNFPLAIPAWKIGAALISGCTTVWKPSPHAPVTAGVFTQLLLDAGLPPGVLNLLRGDHETAIALLRQESVCGASFTGSTAAGQAIRRRTADRFVRTQLEMGGNNAVVVMADADLDAAAEATVNGAFGLSGQRCSATSRVVVQAAVEREFACMVVERAGQFRVGYGFDPDADMGPLIDGHHVEACESAVADATASGARLLAGGRRPTTVLPPGHYFMPTILADVDPTMRVARDEVFGPVLSIIVFDEAQQAVDIVNGTPFGMSAAIFTRDVGRALAIRDGLDVGMIHVNRAGTGAYPHLPHVGAKDSQHGPAECGQHAREFFTRWRTTCVNTVGRRR